MVGPESHPLALTARMWLNDVVMAIFLLLAGLETTREVLVGVLALVAPGACAQGSDDIRHHARSTVTTLPNAATGTMRPGAANHQCLMALAPGLARLYQIALPVQDTDRAVAFYRDVLGEPLLFTAPPGHEPPGSVLYFAVAVTGATHTVLAASGVAFTEPPHKMATLADREVWLAAFTDTEGNPLALMSEPRPSQPAG